ncbi:GNAT family N-acetyltransferase [Asanoa iriomotensis]|uniref:N-acetyltransferase n=1 Tax=Asanoa iriomotensis TaxID=234613 RepID=A0ABQ4C1A2_9ACTN|nr:GNAT family N-acetyltransferase [Asanoa iriomotensis]GIF56558.1 N-acetyltransferase [Asanoa iriomotensis]
MTDTAYATVSRTDDAGRRAVVAILTEAFMDDPVVCWLFPDASERGRLQAGFYRSLLAHPAAQAGLVGRGEGTAVWLTLAAGQAPHPDPPEAGGDFGAHGARLLALGQALAQRHPGGERHLYLPAMGVVRRRQGAGLGSALLRHGLSQAAGLGAYLEASSPRSRTLYMRHGFEDLGEPIRLDGGPPLWPMWRAPR